MSVFEEITFCGAAFYCLLFSEWTREKRGKEKDSGRKRGSSVLRHRKNKPESERESEREKEKEEKFVSIQNLEVVPVTMGAKKLTFLVL